MTKPEQPKSTFKAQKPEGFKYDGPMRKLPEQIASENDAAARYRADIEGDAQMLEKAAQDRAQRTGEPILHARTAVTRRIYRVGGNSYSGE